MDNLDFFFNDKGLKIKYTKRCELCVFAHIDLLTDDLVCEKKFYEFVEDNKVCREFSLKKELKQDMIDGCMNTILKENKGNL